MNKFWPSAVAALGFAAFVAVYRTLDIWRASMVTLGGYNNNNVSMYFPGALGELLDGRLSTNFTDAQEVKVIAAATWSERVRNEGWSGLISEAARDGQPRVVRGALANSARRFDNAWWQRNFGEHGLKLHRDPLLVDSGVVSNVTLGDALREANGSKFALQGLGMSNEELIEAFKLPPSLTKYESYMGSSAFTCMSSSWTFPFHAHPDTTINFNINGRKRWVFVSPEHFLHFRPIITTRVPILTPFFCVGSFAGNVGAIATLGSGAGAWRRCH
eukprot:NODE_13293_length_1174_cov_2.540592.p1 GENE.NODE_13293_length_1174_cov_2.540592~~NODE_13293_length_1174_cov_2.540592.p1  ORF type:complete len:273 (+),score=25.70 NODE_13293_length_1174_cov_2.540592:102-920(+)